MMKNNSPRKAAMSADVLNVTLALFTHHSHSPHPALVQKSGVLWELLPPAFHGAARDYQEINQPSAVRGSY